MPAENRSIPQSEKRPPIFRENHHEGACNEFVAIVLQAHTTLQCCNFLLQQLLLSVNCATRRVCLLTVREASQIFHLSANHEHLSDWKGQSGSCSQAVQLCSGKARACCLLKLAGGEPHPKVFGVAPCNPHPMVNLQVGSCICSPGEMCASDNDAGTPHAKLKIWFIMDEKQ